MTLELTVGDTAPTLTGNVSANLTGALAVVVHILRPDGTVISRAASGTTGTAGAWSLPLTGGDLSTRGTHYVEVQVTFSDGTIQTFRLDATGARTSFRVAEQIA